MNLAAAVQQLNKERDRAQAEVNRLNEALGILENLDGSFRGVRPKKKVSAAARRRMAASQRARRAREKGATPHSKAPIAIRSKRQISAAGLASIRAAQKARWAKWKKKQKPA